MRLSYYGRVFVLGFGIGMVLYITLILNSLTATSSPDLALFKIPIKGKDELQLPDDAHQHLSLTKNTSSVVLEEMLKKVMPVLLKYFEEHMNSVMKSQINKQLPADSKRKWKPGLPPIYVITPTYRRPEQLAELTRLGQTLMHVDNLKWLVVEDATITTKEVTRLLESTGLTFEHLLGPHPVNRSIAKGVSNRMAGMEWIRKHATEGVFYMADDDNSYSIKVFEEMRYTKKVSIWPVGLLTSFGVSTPIVRNQKVVGWYDGYIVNRKFPVDMACFAVSVPFFLQHPNAKMPYSPGYEETGFLRSMNVEWDDLEPKADNCTKIYVWHTRTSRASLAKKVDYEKFDANNSNIEEIEKQLV